MSVSANYIEQYNTDKAYDKNTKNERISVDYKAISPELGWEGNGRRMIFKFNEKTPVIFANSFIDIPFQIVTDTNGAIDSTDVVFVINNAFSKFKRLTFKIKDIEINSISENWFVQHVVSLGLYSQRYAAAVLEDEMDFVIDRERFCRESYPKLYNTPLSDLTDHIESSGFPPVPATGYGYYGLFDETDVDRCTFSPIVTDGNLAYNIAENTIMTVILPPHVDIADINNYYNNWYITFGDNVAEAYRNKVFKVLNSSVAENAGVKNVQLTIRGLRDGANGNGTNLISPMTGNNIALIAPATDFVITSNTKNFSITLFKPRNNPTTVVQNEMSSAARRSLKYHKSKINYKKLPLALSNLLPQQWLDRIVGGLPSWSLELDYEEDTRMLFHNMPNKRFKHVIPTGNFAPKLYVCYPNLSPVSIHSQLYLDNLLNGTHTVDINRYHVETNSFVGNKVNFKLSGIPKGDSHPLYLFVAFHNNNNVIGNGTKYDSQLYNPLVFDNLGISQINLSVGTYQYPSITENINLIKPITNTDLPVRFPTIFDSILRAYDKNTDYESDGLSSISKAQFIENHAIFAFDLESQNFRKGNLSGDGIFNITVEATLPFSTNYQIFTCAVMKKQMVINYKNGEALI